MLTVLDAARAPVSSVLSFYFRDEVLPYYAGDHERAREPGGQRLQVLGTDAARRASAACTSSTTAAPSAAPARSTSRRTGASSRSRCTTSTACSSATASRRTTRRTRSTARSSHCGAGCRGRWPMRIGPFDRAATWADAAMEPLLYLVHRMPYPAQQGRQDPLVPPAAAPGRAVRGPPRHVRRHAGGLGACAAAASALCASLHVETLDPRAARLRSVSRLPDRRGTDAAVLPQRRRCRPGSARVVAQHGDPQGRRLLVADGAVRARPAELRVVARLRRRRLGQVDASTRTSTRWPSSCGLPARGRTTAGLRARRRRRAARPACFVTRGRGASCSSAWRRSVAAQRARRSRTASTRDYFAPHAERASPLCGRRGADRLHRRDGLLAEHRRRHVVRQRRPAADTRAGRPDARFYIVGMNPAPAVQALASRPGVVVTGTVPDVRPYVQHAPPSSRRCGSRAASRTRSSRRWRWRARSSSRAAASVGVRGERRDRSTRSPSRRRVRRKVLAVLDPERCVHDGRAARARILADYSWERNLAAFDRLLDGESAARDARARRSESRQCTRTSHSHRSRLSAAVQRPVSAFVAVAALHAACVLAIFWPTTASMIEIWRRSETFQHCFVVIPIVLWLVWQRAVRDWRPSRCSPFWPGSRRIALLGLRLAARRSRGGAGRQPLRAGRPGRCRCADRLRHGAGRGSSGFRCCFCSSLCRSARRWCRA